MKNYFFLLTALVLLSCTKSSKPEIPLTQNDLLAKSWTISSAKVLTPGYENNVLFKPGDCELDRIWVYKKDGSFSQEKSKTTCTVDPLEGKWSLNQNNKDFTITYNAADIRDFKIIELTPTKLVVQTIQPVGACGTFATTGDPNWVEPKCPTGLVQYEFKAVQ